MTGIDELAAPVAPAADPRVNHFREAERLTAAYKDAITDIEARPTDTIEQFEKVVFAASNARAMLDKAAVHASLAQADATRDLVHELRRMRDGQDKIWRRRERDRTVRG